MLGGSHRVVCEDGAVGDAVECPLVCHERHDGGLDASAQADDGKRRVRSFIMSLRLGVVFSLRVARGSVLAVRGLPVPGGVLDHQGDDAAQAVPGVGSWSGRDPDDAYLKGVATGLPPPVLFILSGRIFHIA